LASVSSTLINNDLNEPRAAREEADMGVVRTITMAMAVTALMGLAGCVDTRGSLIGSADRLDHSAHLLARQASEERAQSDYPTSYARDAHELAGDAREFRDTAEDRRATDTDLREAFERLSRSYHLVRDEVDHSDSRLARDALKPVTDDYLDVERTVKGYPARRASAADDRG
jgi:hypothetical protein